MPSIKPLVLLRRYEFGRDSGVPVDSQHPPLVVRLELIEGEEEPGNAQWLSRP